ncbi:tetrahydrobiopterin biosynthesis enzymes-like protein [Meredithblackwellia eburnea MCA 4105]
MQVDGDEAVRPTLGQHLSSSLQHDFQLAQPQQQQQPSQPHSHSHQHPQQQPPSQQQQPQQQDLVPLLYLTYKTKITAVHRLWSNSLSEQANADRYGSAMQLHGHTYHFSVTFRGPLWKQTGQVQGSDLLEDCVNLAINEVLNRKNLDNDISWFQNRPSTLENVCLFVWRNIDVIMKPHPHDVDEVKVKVEGCWRGKEPGQGGGLGWVVAKYRGTAVMA